MISPNLRLHLPQNVVVDLVEALQNLIIRKLPNTLLKQRVLHRLDLVDLLLQLKLLHQVVVLPRVQWCEEALRIDRNCSKLHGIKTCDLVWNEEVRLWVLNLIWKWLELDWLKGLILVLPLVRGGRWIAWRWSVLLIV